MGKNEDPSTLDVDAFMREAEIAREQFPYDTVATHCESSEYPKDLPLSAARTHIGMYLGWAIERNLIDQTFKREHRELIEKFTNKEILPSEILRLGCNDEFVKEHLNKDGQSFTKLYYWAGWKYSYTKDYQELAGWPKVTYLYYFEDTLENYEIVKSILDKRFKEWKDNY